MRLPTRMRAIGLIAALLMLPCLVPAEAASFGRTTPGAIPSGGLRADFKRGSKFVLTEKGTSQQICAYLDSYGGGYAVQGLRYALYRDRSGIPVEQVVESDNIEVVAWQQAAGWQCARTPATPLEPGTYWIMIHSGDNPAVIRYFYDGPANWYGNADAYNYGASDTFGAGAAGDGTISIRVDYLPESQAYFAGRRTVGTRVSSPMTALMKRGSSFMLTEAAQIQSLNAYIDGRGGATGWQPLWISLYDDVNGEPSALVAQGRVSDVPPLEGRSARWVSAYTENPTYLLPGRYWIVLNTGGPPGVLRYYMDGTGNWRGNTNIAQEPPLSFGPANAGDGTISANILYTPTNVLHHTFGRTTPGTVPSGGLTANYVRGSVVVPDHYFTAGYVTALWAYMDGSGGASGSQKVRLALYKRATPDYNLISSLVMSDEVTIPAGKAPGWVRFPVPYTRFDHTEYEYYGTLHIMMFSGDTQGVARYYASNDADNWHGGPTGYGNSVPGNLYLDEEPYPGAGALMPGTRTISVYGEFVNTAETDSGP